MDENIAIRLRRCLQEQGLLAKDLSQMAGIPSATVSTLLNGKTKDVKADTLFKVSKALGVSATWLYSGVEESEYKVYKQVNKDEYTSIPFYRVAFGAGSQPIPTYEEENDTEPLLISNRILIDSRISAKDCKAFRVIGDSMEPAIQEGDYIIVNCSDTSPIHDGACYAFVDPTNMLRIKILRQRLDRSILIHSINQKYPDETISGEDLNNIQIVGKVIGSFKYH